MGAVTLIPYNLEVSHGELAVRVPTTGYNSLGSAADRTAAGRRRGEEAAKQRCGYFAPSRSIQLAQAPAQPTWPLYPPIPSQGAGTSGYSDAERLQRYWMWLRLGAYLTEQTQEEKDLQAKCDRQSEKDEAICRQLKDAAVRQRCWASVQDRHGACKAKKPLPDLVTE